MEWTQEPLSTILPGHLQHLSNECGWCQKVLLLMSMLILSPLPILSCACTLLLQACLGMVKAWECRRCR